MPDRIEVSPGVFHRIERGIAFYSGTADAMVASGILRPTELPGQHVITDEAVVFKHDPSQPGHNALNQLMNRLDAVLSQAVQEAYSKGRLSMRGDAVKACEDRARWIDHEPEHAMTARECAAEIGRIQP